MRYDWSGSACTQRHKKPSSSPLQCVATPLAIHRELQYVQDVSYVSVHHPLTPTVACRGDAGKWLQIWNRYRCCKRVTKLWAGLANDDHILARLGLLHKRHSSSANISTLAPKEVKQLRQDQFRRNPMDVIPSPRYCVHSAYTKMTDHRFVPGRIARKAPQAVLRLIHRFSL